jgi:dTDP-4-dehydrorhamnose reductase
MIDATAILVTGATGRIGSRVAERLGGAWRIVPATRAAGFDLLDPEGFRREAASLAASAPLRAVVHFAAFTDVSAAHRQRGDRDGECYRLNVLGAEAAARAARDAGAKLVHCSTDFVFGGDDPGPLTEESPTAPIEWYGATKRLAEERVAELTEDWLSMRVAFPYRAEAGPRPDLVRFLREKLRAGETLRLFDDQWITPTCIDDIALAVGAFLDDPSARGIYHVTGPAATTPFALGRLLAEIEGLPPDRVAAAKLEDHRKVDPRPRQRFLRMDNSKLRAYLAARGLPAPRSVAEALAADTPAPLPA